MNRYDHYRRQQRRYAILRAIVAWSAIVIGCGLAAFGLWSALVILLALQP